MGERVRKRIGVRDIGALAPGATIWDAAVTGFGARRQRSEAVAYIVAYRTQDGRQRQFTIGRHGSPWMPETARTEARRILGEVARGQDPAGEKATRRKASTIAELCDAYLDAADRGLLIGRRGSVKKPSTVATDRSRISAHVLPLLGTRKVIDVTPQDVRAFMAGVMEGKTAQRVPPGTKRGMSIVRGGRGAAARTMGLLGAIFTYAVQQGLRADNPVTGIQRPADGQRQRRLSEGEYQGFARGLEALERVPASGRRMHPPALAAARFLILTGWRLGEVLGLTWDAVDVQARVATLGDTKTGRSVRPLSRTAVALLEGQKRLHGVPTVFPPARDAASMSGFISMFRRITKAGGLPDDVTPHILRHSFASLAGDLGFADTTIAALIGHRSSSVTSRYLHRTDAVLLAAADAVAAETQRLMGVQQGVSNVVNLSIAQVA